MPYAPGGSRSERTRDSRGGDTGRCVLLTGLRAPQGHTLPIGDFLPRSPPKPAFTIPGCSLRTATWASAAKHHAREV
jgi:hypothetical protein